MKLLLPERIVRRLRRRLRARIREIGGVLVGEHVADQTFRIVDLSVQVRGGTVAHFVRDPAHHKSFLAKFFQKTVNDYERFNYIGEWHSHPSFTPLPSGDDLATMYDIVADPDVGVNFAVLIIARLRNWNSLELSATLFRTGVLPEPIDVDIDSTPDGFKQSRFQCLLDYFA